MGDNRTSGLSFEEWCARLSEISAKEPNRYGPNAVETCGKESWRGYYDTDYTPESAWDEDGTYD
jgi:hypothetical protein